MDSFYYEIGQAVVGVALLVGFGWVCIQLNNSSWGRLVLFLMATVAYIAVALVIAWSAYALFFISENRPFSYARDFLSLALSVGHSVLIAGFLALIAFLSLIPWNGYARLTERVLGIKVPQLNHRY